MVVVALSGLGVLATTSVAPSAAAAGRAPTGDAFYVAAPTPGEGEAGHDHPLDANRRRARRGARVEGPVPLARGRRQRHRRLRRGGRTHRESAARRASGGDVGKPPLASPTNAHPRSSPTSRPARPAQALATPRAHPDAANIPRRGLCGGRDRLRGARHARLTPSARRREHGARRARRGSRGTRREGCRRREQGARLRALEWRPRGAVRR